MVRAFEPLVPGRAVLVSEGYRNAHTRYELSTQGAIVLATTGLNFAPQNTVFNVRDFGATADGVTDDLPAFEAAFRAMGSIAVSSGAVLEVPAGTYYLDGDLRIRRQCTVRGWGTGGAEGSTFLRFAAGYGIVFESYNSSGPGFGRSDYSIVEKMDISSNLIDLVARPKLGAATLGMLVYAVNENRYFFECVTAGTTEDDEPSIFKDTPALTIGSILADGTAEWKVRVHTGIFMRTRARVRDVSVQLFTNSGILIAAPARADDPINPASGVSDMNANEWQLDHVVVGSCGCGVVVYGGEAQVGTAIGVSVQAVGRNFPDGMGGFSTGGYGFYDYSQFGNTYVGCHVGNATGKSFYAGAPLSCCVYIGCYTEIDTAPPYIATPSVLIGGAHGSLFDPASEGLILSPGQSRNIHFYDETYGTRGGLDLRNGPNVMWFSHTDDNGTFYATSYEQFRPGEWSLHFGGLRPMQSFLGATTDSPGAWRDGTGHFFGLDPTEDIYIGPVSSIVDKHIRGGRFIVGDQFWHRGTGRGGTFSGLTVREEGFRGRPWVANTGYTAGNVVGGVADMVEPTGNDPIEPLAGVNVFRCIAYGTSGATEPTWSAAPLPTNTIADGPEVVWENVGKVALYNRIGEVAAHDRLQTIDDTANQVLARYPLKQKTITYISVCVVARSDAPAGASFMLSGSWYKDGEFDTPVQVRAPFQDQADAPGLTWDAVLSLNGDYVEVLVTGDIATTIEWTAVQKGAEGK